MAYDWELSKALGAARLTGVTLQNATIASALSTALVQKWLLEYLGYDTVDRAHWTPDQKVLDTTTQNAATFFQAQIGPKKFTDALPAIAPSIASTGIDVALEGAMTDLSESKLTKAVDALAEGGRYILVAVEKTRTNAFWYPFGIACTKKTSTVFDPYAGQFTTKKSADVAKHIMSQLKGKAPAANVDAFLLLKATINKMNFLRSRFAPAVAQKHARLEQATRQTMDGEVASSWFQKDWCRFADHSKIVKHRKVVKEQQTEVEPKPALEIFVDALGFGGKWEIPEGDAFYDPNGAALKNHMAQTLKKDDELYKAFALTTQQGLTDYFVAPDGLFAAAGSVAFSRWSLQQITATTPGMGQRFQDADRWWPEIEIEAQTVKVTHHVTFRNHEDAPFLYRIKFHIERTLDRARKTVTTAPLRYDIILE